MPDNEQSGMDHGFIRSYGLEKMSEYSKKKTLPKHFFDHKFSQKH